jgi:hypothetical protein
MTDFWKLPIGRYVEAPDEELPRLEALAASVARTGWGVELESEGFHFRFAKQHEDFAFSLHCRFRSHRL